MKRMFGLNGCRNVRLIRILAMIKNDSSKQTPAVLMVVLSMTWSSQLSSMILSQALKFQLTYVKNSKNIMTLISKSFLPICQFGVF